MTAAGWLFIAASWGLILAVFLYCLYRTLRGRG